MDEGKAVQISSTPTVFVNGRPVIGGDETTLEQYIQFELGPEETRRSSDVCCAGCDPPRRSRRSSGPDCRRAQENPTTMKASFVGYNLQAV